MTKFYLLRNLTALLELIEHFKNVFRINCMPSDAYYAIAQKYSQRSYAIVVWGLTIFYSSLVFYGAMGGVAAYIAEETRPIVMVYFPFVHEYNGITLAALIVVNILVSITCMLMMPPGDILFFVIFCNFPMISEIVQQQMDEYTISLRRCADGRSISTRPFMQFIGIHRQYSGYGKGAEGGSSCQRAF